LCTIEYFSGCVHVSWRFTNLAATLINTRGLRTVQVPSSILSKCLLESSSLLPVNLQMSSDRTQGIPSLS
jgi:hypothetical protein